MKCRELGWIWRPSAYSLGPAITNRAAGVRSRFSIGGSTRLRLGSHISILDEGQVGGLWNFEIGPPDPGPELTDKLEIRDLTPNHCRMAAMTLPMN